ncbi:MAG: hypothetical protein M3443_10575 [Actinomycetota bacterium]|nr:hypothetical protein [Actinomycetota bacterium]
MTRDERTYIRVHDGMPDHPKVEALSDKAFRLLVERWCWSSRQHTDGRIPLAVWNKSATPKVRRELVDARLVEVHEDHVQMHDYLAHQRSAAEIEQKVEKKREAGRYGNHLRWHAERGITDPNCPHCDDTPPSQVRSQKRSGGDRKPSPKTETEKERDRDLGGDAAVSGRERNRSDDREVVGSRPHTPAAHRLVEDYAGTCRRRPPATVLADLAREVDALLLETWPPEEVARALVELGARGKHARLLPAIAHELLNRVTTAGIPGQSRPSTTDQRTAAVQALKADFATGGAHQTAARLQIAGAAL